MFADAEATSAKFKTPAPADSEIAEHREDHALHAHQRERPYILAENAGYSVAIH